MNRNIEAINHDLWAVDFNLLHYIHELGYAGSYDHLDEKIASFTQDGKIVLNKSHAACSDLKMLLQRLMKNKDQDLKKKIIEMRSKNRDPTEEFYLFALDLELKRRSISKEYARGKPFSIKNLIMKKVVKIVCQH